jgi:hypothetical protein
MLAGSIVVPALASPSGQEYLPSVPSATGDKSAGGGSSGSSTVVPAPTSNSVTSGQTLDKHARNTERKSGKPGKTAATPLDSHNARASSGSSPGIAPILIAIIGGVIVVAIAMTLRRRHGSPEDENRGDSGPVDRPTPNARPTPDGEIVAGGDEMR